jgi:acetyl esterase
MASRHAITAQESGSREWIRGDRASIARIVRVPRNRHEPQGDAIMTTLTSQSQGRFADPQRCPGTDPRADPRMVKAFARFGLDKLQPPGPVNRQSRRDAQLQFVSLVEAGLEAMCAALVPATRPEGLAHTKVTVRGVDGNDLELYVSQPAKRTGPLPCVIQLHGGSMVATRAASPLCAANREALAAAGLIVIGVEFRNGGGVLGNHPFPAGLNDCASAVRWAHANRTELGASAIVVFGLSGGGNLCLGTALNAKRDGELSMIDGVYAVAPEISGLYGGAEEERARTLPSLVECDGYFLSCAALDVEASVYDPGGAHARDPLCWPYHATLDDLTGLPPHVISLCELDPLRDEGLAYFRQLLRAGVEARGRTVLGICHACDVILPADLPNLCAATTDDIRHFAVSCSVQRALRVSATTQT